MTPCRRAPLCLLLFVSLVPCAMAQPPDPLSRAGLHAFPGHVVGPASAASAGLALADRWLGDEPAGNPAASPGRAVSLSPQLVRVSRQDLRAEFHQYDETSAFFDAAGGALAVPVGGFAVALYGYQPVLRREENAYTRGVEGAFPPPAIVAGATDSRELVAGVALSGAWAGLRLGVAAEWVRRDDAYDYAEKLGVPNPGLHHAEFSGDAVGGQLGVRRAFGADDRIVVGAALRLVPALSLDGVEEHTYDSGFGDTTIAFAVERESGWEGGVSARVAVSAAFRAFASVGGRSGLAWDPFGVASGPGAEWHVGGELHDAAEPWTLRFGLGQEVQTGVPEPRSGVLGIGFGWTLDATTLDIGALRRTLPRNDQPTSYDDRVIATIRVPF